MRTAFFLPLRRACRKKRNDALINKIYTKKKLCFCSDRGEVLAASSHSPTTSPHKEMSLSPMFVCLYLSNARYLIQTINLYALDDAECNSLRDGGGGGGVVAAKRAASHLTTCQRVWNHFVLLWAYVYSIYLSPLFFGFIVDNLRQIDEQQSKTPFLFLSAVQIIILVGFLFYFLVCQRRRPPSLFSLSFCSY